MSGEFDNLTIRPAVYQDWDQILAWHRQTMNEHAERQPEIFLSAAPLAISEKQLRRLFKGRFHRRRTVEDIRVMQNGSDILGYVWCSIARNRLNKPIVNTSASIYDIFVVEKARRKGIGRKLVQAALEHTHSAGCSRVTATVWAKNAASQALISSELEECYRIFGSQVATPVTTRKRDWVFISALTVIAIWLTAALLS